MTFVKTRWLIVISAVWVFTPELRRVIDWRIGYEAVPLTAALPLLVLVPPAVAVVRRWREVPPIMRLASGAWIVAFGYAFVLGVIWGNAAAAAVAFAQAVLPIFAGIAFSRSRQAVTSFQVLAEAVLTFAAISSAYGIFQYISPPPWDALWMRNVGPILGGYPIPFQVRVFGTLNSAGPFGNFMFVAILLGIAGTRRKGAAFAARIVLCVIALALSSDRSGWLALAVGLAIYAAVSAKRARSVAITAAVCTILGLSAFYAFNALGDASPIAQFQTRVGSLSEVGADVSFNNRLEQIADAERLAALEPLGYGLGTIGTAAKLSTPSATATVLDSGYLSRLVEMGIPGTVGYCVAIFALLVAAAYGVFTARDPSRRNMASVALAIQGALVGLDLSGDAHIGLLGLCFWLAAGMGAAVSASVPEHDDVPAPIVIGRAPYGALVL